MKKAFSTIIPTISAILFAIAIAHLGAGIFKESRGADGSPKARFDALISAARSSAVRKEQKGEFMRQFEEAVGNLSDFGTIRMAVNGKTVYEYVSAEPSARLRTFTASEPVSDSSTLEISAAVSAFGSGVVHSHARIAFILVLAGTALSVVCLFLSSGDKDSAKAGISPQGVRAFPADSGETVAAPRGSVEDSVVADDAYADDEMDTVDESELSDYAAEEAEDSSAEEEEAPEYEPSDEEPSDDEAYLTEGEPQAEVQETEIAEETVAAEAGSPESAAEDAAEADAAESSDDAAASEADAAEAAASGEETASAEAAASDEAAEAAASAEGGTPAEGGPAAAAEDAEDEAAFRRRLSEQLRNNRYKEVSLTLIRLRGFKWGTEEADETTALVREHFGEASEVYRYGGETLAVVLNGVDLETTIADSESVLPAMEEKVGEGSAFIGISAMSYRAIPADRLIVEAEGALARAESDPKSPIVAFKANPDRYKQEIGSEIDGEEEQAQA